MLTLNSVSAVSGFQDLLSDITLGIKNNELHVILGPVNSGKSSLAQLISGNNNVIQTTGTISFNKKNINRHDAYERSQRGIFVSFQTPPEMEGISNMELLSQTLIGMGDKRSCSDVDKDYKELATLLGLDANHGDKSVNGLWSSPGEHKKNEILQMLMIGPRLAVLDSIDESVDTDDLELMAAVINSYVKQKNKSCIVLTRNLLFLDKISYDKIHILVNGSIKMQGDSQLHKRIVGDDYTQFL
jgi:Fe-S cluster assembly ATP-binding protein